MQDKIHSCAAFLLKYSNPSIKLRTKAEVLSCITPNEEASYRDEIRGEPLYGIIAACQK